MKRIAYLMSFIFMFSIFSCEEEDYKNMNITQQEEDVNIKELVGDLTSHIVVKDLLGESITEVDMGQTFYAIDNTEGGANSRTWTITQGSNTINSVDQLVRINFLKPGKATINLISTRSSDGETVSSSSDVNVKNIPVTASFISAPAENGGVVSILQGADVTFTSAVSGSPTIFEWKFEGPEALTSDEQDPTVVFNKVGIYDVTFTAKRDDGDAGISEAVAEKVGYVVVEELVVKFITASITDNILELKYNHPVGQTLPNDAASQYAITIKTAAGTTLSPEVQEVTASGEKTIQLKFADKMYSDDEVFVVFTPAGNIMDATGLKVLTALTDEPCVYGKNLLVGGNCDEEGHWETATAMPDGNWKYTDAGVYQGAGALHLDNYTGTLAVVHSESFEIKKNVQYVIRSYGKLLKGNTGNNLSVRITDVKMSGGFINDKANGMNQLWANLGGYTEEYTAKNWNKGKAWAVDNNLLYSGAYDTSELYIAFFFQDNKSQDTEVLLDYVLVCEHNPRP